LRVADCTDGVIVGNSITKKKYYSIYLTDELQCTRIYGNNFNGKTNNNTLQAFVSATTANPIWDNGTIGNYWNSYLTLYPNASEIGSSGIGDAPFVINSDNVDHFPLMTPINSSTISLPEGDNNGNDDGLPSASYLALAAVSVVIFAVMVTVMARMRSNRKQRTSAPTRLLRIANSLLQQLLKSEAV
jgi:hypothetical protein